MCCGSGADMDCQAISCEQASGIRPARDERREQVSADTVAELLVTRDNVAAAVCWPHARAIVAEAAGQEGARARGGGMGGIALCQGLHGRDGLRVRDANALVPDAGDPSVTTGVDGSRSPSPCIRSHRAAHQAKVRAKMVRGINGTPPDGR